MSSGLLDASYQAEKRLLAAMARFRSPWTLRGIRIAFRCGANSTSICLTTSCTVTTAFTSASFLASCEIVSFAISCACSRANFRTFPFSLGTLGCLQKRNQRLARREAQYLDICLRRGVTPRRNFFYLSRWNPAASLRSLREPSTFC